MNYSRVNQTLVLTLLVTQFSASVCAGDPNSENDVIDSTDAIEQKSDAPTETPVFCAREAHVWCSGQGWIVWGNRDDLYYRQRYPNGVPERLPPASGHPKGIVPDGGVVFVNGIIFSVVRPNQTVDKSRPKIEGKWLELIHAYQDGVLVFPCATGTLGGPYFDEKEGAVYFVPFSDSGLEFKKAVAICPKGPNRKPTVARHRNKFYWKRDNFVIMVDQETGEQKSIELSSDHVPDDPVYKIIVKDGKHVILDSSIFDLRDGSFVSNTRKDLPHLLESWSGILSETRSGTPATRNGMGYFVRGSSIYDENNDHTWQLGRVNLFDPNAEAEMMGRFWYKGSYTVGGSMSITANHPIFSREDGLHVWDGEKWVVVKW